MVIFNRMGLNGNLKWCLCFGKQVGGALKKLKVDLLYDPLFPSQELTQEK